MALEEQSDQEKHHGYRFVNTSREVKTASNARFASLIPDHFALGLGEPIFPARSLSLPT